MIRSVYIEKPHLRQSDEIWSCAMHRYGVWVVGYGYTFIEAWDDFRRLKPRGWMLTGVEIGLA